MYGRLLAYSTKSGFTLPQAIRSGLLNPDSAIGIYAGDAESYRIFSEIFDLVIQEYHGLRPGGAHRSDFSAVALSDPDPEKRYILSTRVRVARNVEPFSFTNHLLLKERQRLEKTVLAALAVLPEPFTGDYFSLDSGADQNILFTKGDRFQEAAGINTDFPRFRGVFYAEDKRFRVWLGEEDHLRLISQDNSPDLTGVSNHLGSALAILEKSLAFIQDERYGYLTTCPTNLGTSMRAGVHIRLKNLNSRRTLLRDLADEHQLQLRGTGGENTDVEGGVFDISNKRRLGLSEVSIVTKLHRGILAIIDAEKSFE